MASTVNLLPPSKSIGTGLGATRQKLQYEGGNGDQHSNRDAGGNYGEKRKRNDDMVIHTDMQPILKDLMQPILGANLPF